MKYTQILDLRQSKNKETFTKGFSVRNICALHYINPVRKGKQKDNFLILLQYLFYPIILNKSKGLRKLNWFIHQYLLGCRFNATNRFKPNVMNKFVQYRYL